MARQLNVLASSLNPTVCATLQAQLAALAFVNTLGVVAELGEAHALASDHNPDVILVDLTDREVDAGLFIQAMSMESTQATVLFALHQAMDASLIVQCVRQGAKEFSAYPADKDALHDALQRLHQFIGKLSANFESAAATAALSQAPQCEVFTVFAPKGGSGATTVAIHLADALRQLTKAKVLLLDMDTLFNNTTVLLNLKPNLCLADLSRDGQLPDLLDPAMLSGFVSQHDSGLQLLTASKGNVQDLTLMPPTVLPLLLDYCKQEFRYVVVDCPSHTLDDIHRFWVEAATQLLVVSGLDVPSLYRTRQYLALVNQVVPAERLQLILNRYDLRAAYGLSNQQLEAEFKHPVAHKLPNDWELNVEANSMGKLFRQLNAQAPLTLALEQLARRLAKLPASTVLPQRHNKGNRPDGLQMQQDVHGLRSLFNKVLGKTSPLASKD
jgi:pilus assembly protein CpaE